MRLKLAFIDTNGIGSNSDLFVWKPEAYLSVKIVDCIDVESQLTDTPETHPLAVAIKPIVLEEPLVAAGLAAATLPE